MKKVSITEARKGLRALIYGLKSGSPVLIVDRGRPVARLEPVSGATEDDAEDRLSRLIRDGIVRPRQAPLAKWLLTEPPPRTKARASVVAAVNEERREGR